MSEDNLAPVDDLPVDRGDELEVVEPEAPEAVEPEVTEPDTDSLGDVLDKEGDETAEEKAEREAAEAAEAAKKRIRIPKARFDEAQNKARAREAALLEEIEKLRGGQQASATQLAVEERRTQISELQDKYEDLILDGMKDEARKVRHTLDAMREELNDYQTTVKSDAARRSAIEELSYNASLANVESRYPSLNPDNEEFDPATTDEVAALMGMFTNSGVSRDVALARAVKYVLGAPPKARDVVDTAAQDAARQRAEAARIKAAAANKQQPASTNRVGVDSDKAGSADGSGIDVMRLSQDKFAKLDEDTKARLRGDIV